MEIIKLLGTVMGIGFISGINLYATVLALGLGIRFEFLTLSEQFEKLDILAHPYVLIPAAIAYTIEFFADKIPWVDSFWDSFHTFIRPIGAAVIAAASFGAIDPAAEFGLILLCGGVAFLSHTTKAGTRLVVNHSPEPFTNAGLSIVEDIIAFVGAWLVIANPVVVFFIVLAFIGLAVWLLPKLFRIILKQFARIRNFIRNGFRRPKECTVPEVSGTDPPPESDAS